MATDITEFSEQRESTYHREQKFGVPREADYLKKLRVNLERPSAKQGRVRAMEQVESLGDCIRRQVAGGPDGQGAPDYWLLETLLDTLAVAQNLTLRAIPFGRVKHLFVEGGVFDRPVREGFGTLNRFRERLSELAKDAEAGLRALSRDRERWLPILFDGRKYNWPVLLSHTDMFFSVLQESDLWYAWHRAWCLSRAFAHIYPSDSDPTAELTYGGAFGDNFAIAELYVPGLETLLLAGPVWRSPDGVLMDPEDAIDVAAILAPLLDRLWPCLESEAPDRRITQERLRRHARDRSPIALVDLRERLAEIGGSLHHASLVHVEESPSARHVTGLALAALLQARYRRELKPFQTTENLIQTWCPIAGNVASSQASPAWLVTDWRRIGADWSVQAARIEAASLRPE
jgi:hypothetical protein